MPGSSPTRQVRTVTSTVTREKRPSLFRVVLLNDDYTPFDFVISLLMSVFGKTSNEAQYVTMQVHLTGSGVAGVFTRDVARTLAAKAVSLARSQGHPLKLDVQKM